LKQEANAKPPILVQFGISTEYSAVLLNAYTFTLVTFVASIELSNTQFEKAYCPTYARVEVSSDERREQFANA
jgi:hypothetical protein